MINRSATRLRVHSEGEDQMISIRPHVVWARLRLLSTAQVVESIEGLRSLIPERVTGDG